MSRMVSTHSRPKAAGKEERVKFAFDCGFNTQPPEGGWPLFIPITKLDRSFQHTAARRRLETLFTLLVIYIWFQHTAARRRLENGIELICIFILFQHTAARRRLASECSDA